MSALKGSTMFKRKPRSPLHGATVHEIEMLHELIRGARQWEHKIPHAVVGRPSIYGGKSVNGLTDMSWYGKHYNLVFARVFDRLRKRTYAEAIQRNIDAARFRDKNPAAYEIKLLRAELRNGTVTPDRLDDALRRVQNAVRS